MQDLYDSFLYVSENSPMESSGPEIFLDERKLKFDYKFNIFKLQECIEAFYFFLCSVSSVQFSSVTQSCPTLCDPMNHSMPGLPVHNHSQSLLKLMPIESMMPSSHVILCHPLLLPPIPPSIRVFSNESALHQVAKVLEFQLHHQSFQ